MSTLSTLANQYPGRRITRALAKMSIKKKESESTTDSFTVISVQNTSTTATSSTTVHIQSLHDTAQRQTRVRRRPQTRARPAKRQARVPFTKRRTLTRLAKRPTTAKGYVYAAGRDSASTIPFRLKKNSEFTYHNRKIPQVDIDEFIRVPEDCQLYHDFITCDGKLFLVYGFHYPTFPLNWVANSIENVAWRGDIVVFQVGVVKGLLGAPFFKREIVDKVTATFMAHVIPELVAQSVDADA